MDSFVQAFLKASLAWLALGAYGFVFNLWRTIDGRPAQRTVIECAPLASTIATTAARAPRPTMASQR